MDLNFEEVYQVLDKDKNKSTNEKISKIENIIDNIEERKSKRYIPTYRITVLGNRDNAEKFLQKHGFTYIVGAGEYTILGEV